MINYSINRTLDGNCHLCIYSDNDADFFRAVRKHELGFDIEFLQKNGNRVFQSYPDDGEKAINNAVAMLNGVIDEANAEKNSDPLFLAVLKAQIEAVSAFRKEAADE